MASWYIEGAAVVTPTETLPDATVVVEGDKISAVGRAGDVPTPPDAKRIDGVGFICVPGLVDIHINGYGGGDALEPDPTSIKLMTRALARDGVTSFVASLVTAPLEKMTGATKGLAKVMKKKPPSKGAELMGIYLEGPFLSPEFRGAHSARDLRKPGPAALDFLLEAAGGQVRVVTVAPELPGGLEIIPRIVAAGATAAIGHTGADVRTLREAADAGARHFVHLFNAMPRFHHREPGPVGFAMGASDTTAEIIGDGVHVHPASLALAYRALGAERLALVSDALSPAGLPPTEGETYRVGGIGRLTYQHGQLVNEEGTLSGAATGLLDGVRRAVQEGGLSLEQAIRMATTTPARIAGIAERKGKIAKGMDADILLLREDLTLEQTYVRGKAAEKPLTDGETEMEQ